ncbi:RNA polymerase-binding protein DksA [Ostreibacterium oceani]|uniref:RNA polymerase-binding transcription factor DksA n=1 Tax=Ostreibacterium oceani TaxID=2654998 RepID=A0A6N7ET07_9GAMM|nr:RNA polymerase-binding protein DksA [Ostreibacterium oceani]MPV85681.1 RNA polymerase-binding protein DksA [Ostreibacterium oceani]
MELLQHELKNASYQLEKNEAYMNARQLAHFKQLLLSMKESILDHASDTKVHLQSDTSKLADIADRASQEEEFSLTLRSRDRERKLIYKIDAALERIVTGDFGYCEKCGVDIGIKRLEARPTAELCIDCKEIEEKKEKTRL